ncbi:MAG: nitroreductase family protein [Desulfobacteraceae bacterium]|nr:nitroreductase family protein [Desulfobacteraceae bacterium]
MLFSVNPELCNQDGICVEACGRRIIEMKGEDSVPTPIVGAEELCNNCGHCVVVCPTGALSRETMNPEDCPPIKKDLIISPEQAEQFFRSRRSIRNYKEKPVGRDKLNKLIEIAGYAPSAHNARPVHFLVIEDTSEVRNLAGMVIEGMRLMIKDAPELAESLHLDRVVGFWESGNDPICRNAPHLIIAHAPEIGGMPHEDCVLALAYLELAAPTLGLGCTWAGYIMSAIISHPPFVEALDLPEGHKCFGVMMVGYPKFKFLRIPLRNTLPVTWRSTKQAQGSI